MFSSTETLWPVWVLLLILTLMSRQLSLNLSSSWAFLLPLLTLGKGQLVVDYFMGLKRSHWAWRSLFLIYLVLVLGWISSLSFLSGTT